jgi:hypothetical protein
MTQLLRTLAFAGTHALLVALYMRWLVDALPPLRDEDPTLAVLPVPAIAALVLAAIHPAVSAATTHAQRLALYGVAVGSSMLLYTLYLVIALSVFTSAPNPWGFIALVVLAQVLYGAPLFLLVGASLKLTSPLLVARPVRAWI